MTQQSLNYRQLFQEEQRKHQEAERVQKEAERAQQKSEEKIRKTTLLEFLNACHVHLHFDLTVQRNTTLSTKNDSVNANDKIRFDRILAWDDFSTSQKIIWKNLQRSNFMHEWHFTSLHILKESEETIYQRMMSSELDLNHFERSTVENHIALIIKQIYNSSLLWERFCLKGSVRFENHDNILSSKREMKKNMQHLSMSERRWSSRLLAQLAKSSESFTSKSMTEAIIKAAKITRSRANQFCVYNIFSEIENTKYRIVVFIIEYKISHKLHLNCIYESLKDMNLKKMIRCNEIDGSQNHFRRLIVAVITQVFFYMIRAELKYEYVCINEAFIFLRMLDNSKTVYYFLFVSESDVKETTEMTSNANEQNQLHLTAMRQVLTFILQALKRSSRSQSWQINVMTRLKIWKMIYDELLNKIFIDDISSSKYRSSRQSIFLRVSSIRLRSKAASIVSSSCRSSADEHHYSDNEFDSDSDTSSRTYRQRSTQILTQALNSISKTSFDQSFRFEGKNVQYCTQKCLRELMKEDSLDKMCSNALNHEESHHQIDKSTFLNLIRQQLFKSLNIDCKFIDLHEARKALFIVRLTSHRYILTAKCIIIDFVAHLKRKVIIYERLRSIHETHMSMYLGNVDLDHSYVYDDIAEIVHMMFIDFEEQFISRHINSVNSVQIIEQFERLIQTIHQLRVLHRDIMSRNILWNAKLDQMMIIDFDRAKIQKSRAILDVISSNWKRKWAIALKKQSNDVFMQEIRRAMIELRETWDKSSLFHCRHCKWDLNDSKTLQ